MRSTTKNKISLVATIAAMTDVILTPNPPRITAGPQFDQLLYQPSFGTGTIGVSFFLT
jgi:hypothetical protein